MFDKYNCHCFVHGRILSWKKTADDLDSFVSWDVLILSLGFISWMEYFFLTVFLQPFSPKKIHKTFRLFSRPFFPFSAKIWVFHKRAGHVRLPWHLPPWETLGFFPIQQGVVLELWLPRCRENTEIMLRTQNFSASNRFLKVCDLQNQETLLLL